MLINKKFTLEGLTKKGKERVKRDGATGWVITSMVDKVQFSNEKGPWLLIKNETPNSSRWVHATNDLDFKIKETTDDTK